MLAHIGKISSVGAAIKPASIISRSWSSVNKVIMVGIVGAEPTSAVTNKNIPVANFTVGVKSGPKREDGSQTVDWHKCVTFSSSANFVSTYLKKGQVVYVEGSMRNEDFTDKQGVNRRVTKILADSVQIVRGEWKGTEDGASSSNFSSTENGYGTAPSGESVPN
jgi:single-strand DNA-binding protein